MNLSDIIKRDPQPVPWSEGEKIPWNERGFSERMLQEHLNDAHDAASRRQSMVDQHVNWLHSHALQDRPTTVLDLGCGPGLYAERLARLGHEYVGIDFSPASIRYARAHYPECQFLEGDVREVDFGSGFGLIMMIYGELNVFHPDDARLILEKCRQALADDGVLLLEVHSFDAIRRMGQQPPSWRSYESGLFSPDPHLLLQEAFWNHSAEVSINRYFVIDVATGTVQRYADSVQAYSNDGYQKILKSAGFDVAEAHPSLDGSGVSGDFPVYVATTSRRA